LRRFEPIRPKIFEQLKNSDVFTAKPKAELEDKNQMEYKKKPLTKFFIQKKPNHEKCGGETGTQPRFKFIKICNDRECIRIKNSVMIRTHPSK
jgi:hypothetical protein